MASQFASLTSEEIIQINFCGVYYLTVLVYTKTTIHLSVGGWQWIFYLAASQLSKYPLLATSTSVNSCWIKFVSEKKSRGHRT